MPGYFLKVDNKNININTLFSNEDISERTVDGYKGDLPSPNDVTSDFYKQTIPQFSNSDTGNNLGNRYTALFMNVLTAGESTYVNIPNWCKTLNYTGVGGGGGAGGYSGSGGVKVNSTCQEKGNGGFGGNGGNGFESSGKITVDDNKIVEVYVGKGGKNGTGGGSNYYNCTWGYNFGATVNRCGDYGNNGLPGEESVIIYGGTAYGTAPGGNGGKRGNEGCAKTKSYNCNSTDGNNGENGSASGTSAGAGKGATNNSGYNNGNASESGMVTLYFIAD